ncbi:MAG: hypothetical protein ABI904_14505 [Chloroflexota bacterium]
MDTFEYALVSLILGERIYEEDEEGKKKQDIRGKPSEYRTLSVGITVFDTIENNSGEKSFEKFDLGKKIYREYWRDGQWNVDGYRLGPTAPILEMGPYLAKLGKEGWEVIEYKFRTDSPVFGQALLKRKSQQF